jgi:hypothetical protein
MKKQTVTLKIIYDEQNNQPADWDWSELCDLGPEERVKVVAATAIEDVQESDTDEDEDED